MKRITKTIIRRLFGAKQNENFLDCCQRKKYHFLKRINRKNFSVDELKRALIEMGLKKNDIVVVHSAWRSFVGFDGRPEDVIDVISNIVGEGGTILMPSYGKDRKKLQYSEPTTAGVLAEIFRKKYASERSLSSYFSMSASGKKSKRLTESHLDSLYYFDEKSPYWKTMEDGGKILLLGLGKHPYKISLFHCVAYNLKGTMPEYANIYSDSVKTFLVDRNGKKFTKTIINKGDRIKNNNKIFKRLFREIIKPEEHRRINYLDIYLFDSKDLFNRAQGKIVEDNINIYRIIK